MMKRTFFAAFALSLCFTTQAVSSCDSKPTTGDKLELTVAKSDKMPNVTPDLTYAAERAVNSVVYIKVVVEGQEHTVQYRDPFEDFFGDFFGGGRSRQRDGQKRTYKEPDRRGAGSGVILTKDGYIVTNNHVVEGATKITVKLNDNREFKGRIIGTDKNSDLALIKIEAKDLQPIVVANSDSLRLGQWVLAIGNPFSLTSTVTAGIVSAKARVTGGNPVESSIQTDAAINPGNSGGALVNARGELVGINNMIFSQTGSYTGYGFAIPTTIMNKVVQDLKQYGVVQRALLGIKGTDLGNYIDLQKEKGKEINLGTTSGVYVAEVVKDGAAQKAGLKEGDVIIGLAGKTIHSFGEMQEILSNHRPGDKVKVVFMRDKKQMKSTIELLNAQGTNKSLEKIENADLGVALRPLSKNEKKELNLTHGLMVSSVKAGLMQEAGIKKGLILMRINDVELQTPEDFDKVVKDANLSSERVLWIRAKTQSGVNKSFTVDLDTPKK